MSSGALRDHEVVPERLQLLQEALAVLQVALQAAGLLLPADLEKHGERVNNPLLDAI